MEEAIPQAFAEALTCNPAAADTYAMMTKEEKAAVLAQANRASNGRKLRRLVRSLAREQEL